MGAKRDQSLAEPPGIIIDRLYREAYDRRVPELEVRRLGLRLIASYTSTIDSTAFPLADLIHAPHVKFAGAWSALGAYVPRWFELIDAAIITTVELRLDIQRRRRILARLDPSPEQAAAWETVHDLGGVYALRRAVFGLPENT